MLVGAAFIIALGFGLISPILPQYARSFEVSIFAASAAVSAFAFFRLLFAPVSGRLVDSVGYRRTYVTGLTIVAVSAILVGLSQSYWQLIAFRALGGIGSTMFTVSAMGLIVRISPPDVRGRCSAAYGSAFLLGSVFGPVLGAALGQFGMRPPFFIYGAGLLVATTLVAVLLNDASLRHQPGETEPAPMTFATAWRIPSYKAALLGGFANGWSNFGVRVAIVPLFAASLFSAAGGSTDQTSHYGSSNATATAGLALTAFAIGNVIALQFSGKLSDSIGRKPVVVAGFAINGLFTALLGFSSAAWVLLAVCVIAGFGAGMLNPSQQAAVADIIGGQRSGGKVLAAYQMAQDSGAILGPLAVGLIADQMGYTVGFVVCGAISAVALVGWLNTGGAQQDDKKIAVRA